MKIRFYVDPEPMGRTSTATTSTSKKSPMYWPIRERIVLAERDHGSRSGGLGMGGACGSSIPDPEPVSAFVITAYELTGKPLIAYRRRRKRKGKR